MRYDLLRRPRAVRAVAGEVEMFSLIFVAGALIGAAVHLFVSRQPRTGERAVEVLLLYLLVVFVGVGSLFAAGAHVFRADQTAREIGWPPGSPFQFEVGMANLAIGVCGVLCAWFRRGFWASTVLSSGIFLFGDGIGHIKETVQGNYAEYNAGPILYTDLIVPLVALVLLLLYTRAVPWHRERRRETATAGA